MANIACYYAIKKAAELGKTKTRNSRQTMPSMAIQISSGWSRKTVWSTENNRMPSGVIREKECHYNVSFDHGVE